MKSARMHRAEQSISRKCPSATLGFPAPTVEDARFPSQLVTDSVRFPAGWGRPTHNSDGRQICRPFFLSIFPKSLGDFIIDERPLAELLSTAKFSYQDSLDQRDILRRTLRTFQWQQMLFKPVR